MKRMIGVCGLDCSKCDAYIATKTNNLELKKKTAELWSKYNKADITSEMINCEGCTSNGKKNIFCSNLCNIRMCAIRNNYNTCADCKKKDTCSTLAFILNHNKNAKNNLK